MNFFTKIILGTVVVLVAAAAIVLLSRSREAARVEALLREAVGWAEKGEADRLADLIDDQFEDGAEWARSELRRQIRSRGLEKIEIMEISVTMAGDEARAYVVLKFLNSDYPVPQGFTVKLRKRDDAWRVFRVRREDRAKVTT